MAKPITAKFGKFFVRLSDGGSPAQFIAPCGFTSKGLTRSKNFGEVNVPDCDDPDAPAWVERDVQSMTASISGDGVLAKSAVSVWEDALASSDSIESEVEVEWPDGSSDVWTGKFHVESFEITATLGERVSVSVSLQSDGPIAYARSGS